MTGRELYGGKGWLKAVVTYVSLSEIFQTHVTHVPSIDEKLNSVQWLMGYDMDINSLMTNKIQSEQIEL